MSDVESSKEAVFHHESIFDKPIFVYVTGAYKYQKREMYKWKVYVWVYFQMSIYVLE